MRASETIAIRFNNWLFRIYIEKRIIFRLKYSNSHQMILRTEECYREQLSEADVDLMFGQPLRR